MAEGKVQLGTDRPAYRNEKDGNYGLGSSNLKAKMVIRSRLSVSRFCRPSIILYNIYFWHFIIEKLGLS